MANTLTFANDTLTDANIYGGINYICDLNTGDEFSIGNTASASVSFVTDVQLPIYTKDAVNGTFVWEQDSVTRGRFYITEVTRDKDKYMVTAYDAMILLETSISVLSFSFPITVSAAASAIATYLGCTISGTIYNGTMTADSIEDTTTIREVLGWVAEASGCSVKIDGSDHLCFMYYADSGITVSASEYKEDGLNVADYTCAAIDNVTILDMAGMTHATAGSGTNSLFIMGNPFMYDATNTEAATILSLVEDFEYAPFTCEMFEENGLEVGTIATFGTTETLVMHIESGEDGAAASAVGSDSRAELNKNLDVMVNEALTTATSLSQHFWYTASGSEAGAHIAEVDKATFEDNPSGGNLLSTSSGIKVRDGLDELAAFGVDGSVTKLLGMPVFVVNSSGASESASYSSWVELQKAGTDGDRITYTLDLPIDKALISSVHLQGYSGGYGSGADLTYGVASSGMIGGTSIGYEYDGDLTILLLNLNPTTFSSVLILVSGTFNAPYFSLGTRMGAVGAYSAVIGKGLVASHPEQLALGKYNNNESANVLEIGNGTDDSNRSNAFAVDGNGNVKASGSLHTNRGVLTADGTQAVTATGQYLHLCSLTLEANSKYIILSNIGTTKGTSLTLSNTVDFTNNPTVFGNIARVTTTNGQGVTNWYYVATGSSASVATLTGYAYTDGGTGYSQRGYMIAIPL